ncbi:MAG TPA: hypothetical protein VFE19_13610 [Jatrophihabitantaceae bacterium]|jgi:hypothetical protein|nr:hypothetical protein [Jatrophihabitantaceae bacterium]
MADVLACFDLDELRIPIWIEGGCAPAIVTTRPHSPAWGRSACERCAASRRTGWCYTGYLPDEDDREQTGVVRLAPRMLAGIAAQRG